MGRPNTRPHTVELSREELAAESWKDISSIPYHQVSDHGRIRVLRGKYLWARTREFPTEWKVLHQRVTQFGYLTFSWKEKYQFVHRLVLEAFVGPRPPKADTRHLNDDKKNNRISNLCWGSRSDNIRDAVLNGKRLTGEDHPKRRLSRADVLEMIRRRRGGEKLVQLARHYCVAVSHVSGIMSGKKWPGLLKEA